MRVLVFIVVLVLSFGRVSAQKYGSLSGSFETNTIYYSKDNKIGATQPEDKIGTNNYLKLGYSLGKFVFGIQFEGYYPVLVGYPEALKEGKIMNKFIGFSDRDFSVTVGDFYEQFGNGLVFRAYEDRTLGFNNSVEGVNASYSSKFLTLRGIWGRQRKFMDYGEGKVRGIDLSLNLAESFRLPLDFLAVEGSWVGRYQSYSGNEGIPSTVEAFSGRINLSEGGFHFKAEYAEKTKDPSLVNGYTLQRGNALLVDLGYTGKGFGILAMARRLEYMDFRSERDASELACQMNYLPSLTRQHEYALACLNPHSTLPNGEIGGQLDLFYNIPAKSAVGGRYGMKLHVNMSGFYNLKRKDIEEYEFFKLGNNQLYRDINFDILKKWNSRFKTILLASFQKYNTLIIGKPEVIYTSSVGVLDMTYKVSKTNSVRLELQHLWSQDDHKNWMYAMLEYTVAPSWSFYASDMYNYGDTDNHYYNGGISFAKSRTRVAVSYGRNREGYTCSGGVCRYTPAFTGLNLVLSSSF